jgi:hypothetical protein
MEVVEKRIQNVVKQNEEDMRFIQEFNDNPNSFVIFPGYYNKNGGYAGPPAFSQCYLATKVIPGLEEVFSPIPERNYYYSPLGCYPKILYSMMEYSLKITSLQDVKNLLKKNRRPFTIEIVKSFDKDVITSMYQIFDPPCHQIRITILPNVPETNFGVMNISTDLMKSFDFVLQ